MEESFTTKTLKGFGSSSELLATGSTILVGNDVADFVAGKADDGTIDSINVEPLSLAEGGESGLEETPGKPNGCSCSIRHDSTTLYLHIS